MKALDLFCCAGGATRGLQMAGFHVTGIDIRPQPRYCGDAFIQADALKPPVDLRDFDFIWASPPCQSYSDLAKRNGNAHKWPRLIDPVREMLVRSGKPYVIENVEGAPLINPAVLCGTMFKGLRVLRHRLFESNFPIVTPEHGKHPICHTFDKRKGQFGKTDEMRDFVSVTGGGNCSVAAARDAMGIDWMTKNELNEAIPPAYSHFIARQFLETYRADYVSPGGVSCGRLERIEGGERLTPHAQDLEHTGGTRHEVFPDPIFAHTAHPDKCLQPKEAQ